MNFNQLTAAAAAAAAGNPNNNLSMSSFTTAVTNILANSNIDLSQLANISPHLPAFSAALELRRNRDQQQHHQHQQQSSRQNLHQAHRSTGANHPNPNSLVDLPSSMSNLQSADAAAAAAAAAAAVSVAGLPASISNLTSSALADLAANAAAAASAAHQPQAHSGRSASIQSAHHRSSNHHNHHSTNQLTAAHQSTSAANKAANLAAHQHHHQSQQHHHHHQHQNTIHHRHSSSSHHNSLSNHNHSINNINNHSSNNLSNNSIIMNNSTNSLLNSSILPTSTATIIATNNTNTITPPKDSICYRIGDCVYFETTTSSTSPTLPSPQQYQIGRIDEICKTPSTTTTTTTDTGDNIEVKVVVFFRRRDISSSLMTLADKYQYDETQEEEIKSMSEKDKNLLKQRELFYSRQIETIPATSIRGKCTVQLLNESESFASYLNKEDHYFYTLVYDPQQKTITADRGEIRVGQRYQAEVQPAPIYKPQPGGSPDDPRDLNELETLVYTPNHNLTDDDINKFLTIAKSVGTFARALDCSSSIKQPSLHLTAASASRDVTLLYAMQLLHQNNYDLGKAVCALVPSTGPILCRDEIEEWTSGEAALFEEAIEKYGREFGDIRHDFLPWKSVKNIVEYYYMWKTTDRSINQRRVKALEAENKVTVLYISDPENNIKIKKSPRNVPTPTSTNTSAPEIQNNNNDSINNNNNNNSSTPSSESSKTASTTPALSTSTTQARSGSASKRTQESEDSSMNSSIENTNATLKRRQVTEPKLSAHVACHTTPGENLRFISTKRHKVLRRGMINRKQLRHLCRRPWERRAKSRA